MGLFSDMLNRFRNASGSETTSTQIKQDVSHSQDEVDYEDEPTISTAHSVFSIDDNDQDNAINTLNSRYRETNSGPVLKAREGKIQDVLEVMRIPETFDLEPFVLLPEDLDEVDFSVMVPKGYGYDQSEVDSLFARVKDTISEYLRLLKLRNEHIAQLASTVDRLQVDAYNARYDAEIANGINIMPTQSMADLENEVMELRLLVKKLSEENERLQSGRSAEGYEQIVDERLSDQVSVLSRENEDLRDENTALREKLSTLQDEAMNTAHSPEGVTTLLHAGLPDLGEPEDMEMLESNATFAQPEESLADFLDEQSYYTASTDDDGEGDSLLDSFYQD